MATRREAIEQIFKSSATLTVGGLFLGAEVKDAATVDFAIRPPGALQESEFVKACINCGQCVEDCPYDSIMLSGPGEDRVVGKPYLNLRETPCYMCPDIPCTNVCPTGALELKNFLDENSKITINQTKMGLAVIHKESCLAYMGIQCDACYRACPLIDQAIKVERKTNQVTLSHANIFPVVDSDYCTGCGMCEHACVTEKAAIFVLPRDKAMGKLGDHYIKSWEKSDERRIRSKGFEVRSNDDNSSLDYLNDGETLFD